MALFKSFQEYYAINLRQKPSLPSLITMGIFSGVFAQFVTYPLTLIRTKLQTEGIEQSKQYKNFRQCVKFVYKNSGIRGFYSGVVSEYVKSVPAACISFFVFDSVKKFMVSKGF